MSSDDDTSEPLERSRDRTTDGPPPDREEIESLATDPDPYRDLGYQTTDWQRISAADGSDQLVFLPADEEQLLEDAFIIVPESDLRDLRTSH